MKAVYGYIIKKYNLWISMLLLALLSHGTMFFTGSIGIDTEDIMVIPGAMYNEWYSIGRQGLVLLKRLMGTSVFNPYFAGLMSLFFMVAACVLWTYLFSCVSGKDNRIAALVFSVLLIVSPLITEQLYFKLQSMEVLFGFCLAAVSLLFVYFASSKAQAEKRFMLLAGSVALNLVIFSIYQVMVPLFIFGAAACVFLYCSFSEAAEAGILKKMTVYYLAVFFISFILNQIITVIWFNNGSGYLTGQIRWLTQSFKDCLINIYWHVKAVMLGKGLYYSKLYPVGCLIMAAAVISRGRKRKNIVFAVNVISMVIALAAPFYMTVLCALEPVRRSQMVMPFALAFVGYVLVLFMENKKRALYILLIMCAASCYAQLKGTIQLNYTDSMRYDSDVRIAQAIMEDLEELGNTAYSYPIVFIGRHKEELNNSCVKGDMIGCSFFDWDTDVEPHGFYSTRRIVNFMNTLGGNYIRGNEEQTVKAAEYSKRMNSWPMQGSIELHNGCIIVKLSD